jgi:hypothetical protein
LDDRLGLDGRYSPTTQRLICLAGASWSFDVASERLEELCGLLVSDTTIRELSQRQGALMLAWQRDDPKAVEDFRQEQGDVEFTTDGTSVNTTEGWREMKVGIFSKRDRGEPALPAEWDSRTLPAPKGRVCFAAIDQSERFGSRWKAWRQRLGLIATSTISVLADGAKWIWEEQRRHLTYAEGVLDIFHALEHVAATAKALFDDPSEQTAWTDAGRTALLTEGFAGIVQHVNPSAWPEWPPSAQAALTSLLDYLAPHEHHLAYAKRLLEGRSIGSGPVEGACKNLIGRRLKQTGARWRVRRVNRMAGLCSIMYSHQWDAYWATLTT